MHFVVFIALALLGTSVNQVSGIVIETGPIAGGYEYPLWPCAIGHFGLLYEPCSIFLLFSGAVRLYGHE